MKGVDVVSAMNGLTRLKVLNFLHCHFHFGDVQSKFPQLTDLKELEQLGCEPHFLFATEQLTSITILTIKYPISTQQAPTLLPIHPELNFLNKWTQLQELKYDDTGGRDRGFRLDVSGTLLPLSPSSSPYPFTDRS